MLICRTFAEIRGAVGEWRRSGEIVVFVPTLGNLHDGHLQLVELGARHGKRVVVSIFVNQLQFGRNEDYALYPRTLDADVEKLRSVGADALFCPSDAEVYPNGVEQQTWFEDGVSTSRPTASTAICEKRGDQTAIIWEGDDPGHAAHITYRKLHERGLPLRQRAEGATASRRATASPSTCR
jgi:pantoate--beta-alanine ligase